MFWCFYNYFILYSSFYFLFFDEICIFHHYKSVLVINNNDNDTSPLLGTCIGMVCCNAFSSNINVFCLCLRSIYTVNFPCSTTSWVSSALSRAALVGKSDVKSTSTRVVAMLACVYVCLKWFVIKLLFTYSFTFMCCYVRIMSPPSRKQ